MVRDQVPESQPEKSLGVWIRLGVGDTLTLDWTWTLLKTRYAVGGNPGDFELLISCETLEQEAALWALGEL